jgi:hypothetical protein
MFTVMFIHYYPIVCQKFEFVQEIGHHLKTLTCRLTVFHYFRSHLMCRCALDPVPLTLDPPFGPNHIGFVN